MANEERGEVEFAAGEQSYTLVLSMNAICEMQTRTKKTYGQLVQDMAALDIVALREILWMTLKKHHAKEFPNADAVGEMVYAAGGPNVAVAALNRLFDLNSKARVPGEGSEADPQKAQG